MHTPFSALAYEFKFAESQRGFSRRCLSAGTESLDFRDQGYEFPYVRLASTFTRPLPSNLVDLLDIAAAVYLADRLSPRRHAGRQHGPLHQHRAIGVCLPVSDPALWSSKEVVSILEEALRFLTGDSWNFTFKVAGKTAVPAARQEVYLFDLPPEREPKAMLFSGGLDSFAGAVHQLEDPERFHVLVSASTHNRMANGQRKQAQRLFAGRPHTGQHVVISHGLVAKPVGLPMESSQRSRGFFHVSLGAAAALLLGAHELFVYENGIGAINLPFDASQVGMETSHAVHPKFLWLMERLLARIGGSPFFIRTPFLFLTKAEALRHPRMRDFGAGIAETFSCDRFPNWHEHRPQCGACPSCVLRRLSLEAAGLAELDPAVGYTSDINESLAPLSPAAAFVLDKFDAQARRLHKFLAAERPWSALSRAYPELREVQYVLFKCSGHSPEEVESRLLRLYGEHAAEWNAFSGSRTLDHHLRAAA